MCYARRRVVYGSDGDAHYEASISAYVEIDLVVALNMFKDS